MTDTNTHTAARYMHDAIYHGSGMLLDVFAEAATAGALAADVVAAELDAAREEHAYATRIGAPSWAAYYVEQLEGSTVLDGDGESVIMFPDGSRIRLHAFDDGTASGVWARDAVPFAEHVIADVQYERDARAELERLDALDDYMTARGDVA